MRGKLSNSRTDEMAPCLTFASTNFVGKNLNQMQITVSRFYQKEKVCMKLIFQLSFHSYL